MKEQLTNLKKEELTRLNNRITKYIEALDTAENEKQLNAYLNYIWDVTRQIRNVIGSPNSRKN